MSRCGTQTKSFAETKF